jgi:hypothetical protein
MEKLKMHKLIGGTLAMALACAAWAGPQTSPAAGNETQQTAKPAGKKSGKHTKRHSKKNNTTTSQPQK